MNVSIPGIFDSTCFDDEHGKTLTTFYRHNITIEELEQLNYGPASARMRGCDPEGVAANVLFPRFCGRAVIERTKEEETCQVVEAFLEECIESIDFG